MSARKKIEQLLCWHRWDKWRDHSPGITYVSAWTDKHYQRLHRNCKKCGKPQIKHHEVAFDPN